MKEKKVMEVIEKDINSFALLVFKIAVDLATNAVIELIEDVMEDNINKKETEREIN